jgi:hypothetical protein
LTAEAEFSYLTIKSLNRSINIEAIQTAIDAGTDHDGGHMTLQDGSID